MLLPVPAGVPPHEAVYHLAVAPVPTLPPTSVKVVLPPLQITVVPAIFVGATDSVLNEIIGASVVVSPLQADVNTAR